LPKVQVDKSLDQDKIKKIADLLKGAKSVLFITGAGISADSGLPTYRGISGLYNDKTTEDGIPIEMALAGETLETKPHITWKYLARIEEKCRGAKPNRAHEIIKEMEKYFERVCVFTQNIDGLHHRAGSKNIIDIHGDMYKLICPHCMWRGRIKDYSEIRIPPVCPECNKIVRPQVVFFGEILPYDKCQVLLEELEKGFDVYFSVGTTSVFHYISQPMVDAKANGKPTIEINPDQTHISGIVDIKLPLAAAEVMEKIWKELQSGC
jgi:NAD-dependent deacetylase